MYLGETQQDKFVINVLNEKENGCFVEIGSNHPISINNTYLLEKFYRWKGIMIEYISSYLPMYIIVRPNSVHVIKDARIIDYRELFETNNIPSSIDYLQIDLEVDNSSTIRTLQKLDCEIFDDYKFATITFEHSIYCGNFYNTRSISRNIFLKRGYIRVFDNVNNGGNACEDWYVYPDLVNMEYVNNLIEINRLQYEDSDFGRTINCKNIVYP